MKRLLAILCTLALMLSALSPAVFAAENSSLQAAMDDDSSEIIVLEEDTSNLTVDRDTYLDLNGHSIDGVTVTGGTLYCLDSQTADYTVADGIYGHVTNVTGNVKAAEGYLQVGDSFHAVNLDIYAMTLRASDVGVYYKSNFAADEVVAEQVESFGVALSVVTAPNAENLDSYCGYSVFTGFEAGEGANATGTSTLLKGIMKAANGDNKNAKNAAMPIYGSAYIKTAEGYVFGETVKRSLQEQVEAIDGVWASLSETQKAPVLGMLESYTAVMESWNIPNIRGIQVPGADAEIEMPIEVTAENGIVTEAVTVEQDGVSVTVPAGVKLAEGAEALTLTVTPKEESDTGIQLEKNEVLMPMDVHVEGLAADNAQPLTIYLGKIMPENLNMGNYTVYHVENGNANEMTLIPVDAEFTAHNQYKYSLDGELTLYVATFSEFAARATTDNTWNGTRDYSWYNTADTTLYIRNADQLAAFGAIVGGMDGQTRDSFTGKTVKLLTDIDLGDENNANKSLIFHPIGYYYTDDKNEDKTIGDYYSTVYSFSGIFDGNGNTVSNFHQNTWEIKGDYSGNYYNDAMGLFGYVVDGTVKNLTVGGFSSEGEFAPTGVITAYAKGNVTFENISLVNCHPQTYNTGVAGIVGWDDGGDTAETASKFTYKNISIDDSNTISALWGSWDVAAAGLQGYLGKYSTANLDNCHVAATIDVFNDVCGNYQYYWYRYCGMLIGTVDRTDAEGNVDLTGITAANCSVNFGENHEYYYCEFVKNTQASYTHDYQFSRIPHSDLAFTDSNGNGKVDTDEERASVTGCKNHNHEAQGMQVINGNEVLVEDKQAVYIPFKQLFGGYGWGVNGFDLDEYNDKVAEEDKIEVSIVTTSEEKFEIAEDVETSIASGATLTIGQLFAPKTGADIDLDNVQVFVSPADDQSTASGTYIANAADWTKGTLKFSGMGAATITITDYYFCTPTTITVTIKPVAQIGEVEYASLQNALDAVEDGGTVTLLENVTVSEYLDIYTPNLGETERSFTLDLDEHTITPAADYDYEWYPMIFVGINQTVTIKDGTIVPNEYVAVGAYGSVTLENVDIVRKSEGEEVVCVWNWSESDKYYEDCPYHITGSATINGGNIVGGVIVEGPLTLNETADIDKLYLNTKTGYGKFILPDGYGLVNKGDYYADLHKHDTDGAEGACTVCGLAFYYVETDLSQIDSTDTVVITMTKDGTTWALTNDNGTGSAPAAPVVTITGDKISGEVQSNLLWNISNIAGNLTIYPKGVTDKWLYCTNTNNGVRVGTNTNDVFTINADGEYLQHTATVRYIGVYIENGTAKDWRCYNNTENNIKDQTLKFYVLRSNCQHSDEDRQENRERIEATCTVAGREAGLYCLNCDTYIENGALINATGHTYGNYVTVKEPTCTRDGKEARYCSVCNKANTRKIDALGHNFVDGKCSCGAEVETVTITFSVNGETTSKTVEMGATVQLSELGIAVEAPAGYSFAGWVTEAISEETTTEPVILTEYEAKEATTLYALFTRKEITGNSGYTLVKDIAELVAGKHVVIVAKDANYALSTNQKENNRGAAVVEKSGDVITFGEDVQILTLEAGEGDGTYAFYTGSGYLYAAASGSNHLKTQTANNVNGSWTITFNSDGVASVVAKESSNRNVMQYNPNNGSPLFACYASASQEPLSIYIEAGSTEIYYTTNVCAHINTTTTTVEATCTEAGSITETCNDCGKVIGENVLVALDHSYDEGEVTTPATCTTTGVKTYTCTREGCGATKAETIEALGHNYVDGTCSVCGEKEPTTEEPAGTETITFNLGANGTATHYDGKSSATYSETVDSYTLSLTGGTQMYTGARDAKGNSCIKLASKNNGGRFTFTVPADVTEVKIYIAGYTKNSAEVSVNSNSQVISVHSDDGQYAVITVDTTNNKTVTISVEKDHRVMINTIEFIVPAKAN